MTCNSQIYKYYTVIFICAALFTGCLTGREKEAPGIKDVLKNFEGEPVVPREANKIIIPVFKDLTNRLSVSEKLTVKIKEQINLDGRLAVVPDNVQGDLMLRGIVTEYQLQGVKYNGFDKPVRKRLRIIVSVKLIDLIREREIFFEKGIQAFEEFSDIIPPVMSEIQILDKVLDDLAKRIALKTINGWYTKLMTQAEKGGK